MNHSKFDKDCRYGIRCHKVGCLFKHPQPKPKSQLLQQKVNANDHQSKSERANNFLSNIESQSSDASEHDKKPKDTEQTKMIPGSKYFPIGLGLEKQVILKQICRYYHQKDNCRFGKNCRKIHKFTIDPQSSQKITRKYFVNNAGISYAKAFSWQAIPQTIFLYIFNSKKELCRFGYDTQKDKILCFTTLQMPMFSNTELVYLNSSNFDILLVNRNHSTKQFDLIIGESSITEEYDLKVKQNKEQIQLLQKADLQKANLLKLSNRTILSKIVEESLQKNKNFSWSIVPGAHCHKITSVIRIDEKTLLSCCLGGRIRVWKKNQQGYFQNNDQIAQIFQCLFNPKKQSIELLFMQMLSIEGSNIIFAGTNIGRLSLFKIENQNVQYDQIKLTKQIRLTHLCHTEHPDYKHILIVLGRDSTDNYLLVSQYPNSCFVQVLKEPHQNANFYTSLAVHHDTICVGGLGGVAIYNLSRILRGQSECVGCIYNNSETVEMTLSEVEFQDSMPKSHILSVIQAPSPSTNNEGSTSLYQIK